MLSNGSSRSEVPAGTLCSWPTPDAKEERLRSSIADYEVIESGAAGPAGGDSYLCRPPARLRLEDPVAVTELGVDATRWQQLADLVVRLANVVSPDMLRLLEIGPDVCPETVGVYLATESAPGGSLARPVGELDRAGRFGAVAAAARAAHAMHEAGLAHGSIWSARVLLTDRGPALAPPRLDAPAGVVTAFSSWAELATVDPDLLSGEYPSRSSDIWSLGSLAHGALSDQPLYPGIQHDEAVTAVQRVLFTRPEIDSRLPAEAAEIVTACLERDPAARPETALEVAERLAGAMA